jgi:hypothetical protein
MTPIVIDFYGKIYTGWYECVDRGMVYVSSVGLGSKAARIGNSTPESVGRMLLRELVREVQKRNQPTEGEQCAP